MVTALKKTIDHVGPLGFRKFHQKAEPTGLHPQKRDARRRTEMAGTQKRAISADRDQHISAG